MKKSLASNYYFWALVLTLLLALFGINGNLIALVRAKHTIHVQQKQIEKYESEIRQLDARIDARSTDRDSLERYAREHYFFAAEGDDVYIVDK